MKRNFLVLVLFVGLTFPAWKALRHPGMISGHDTESAVFKSQEFFNALKDGHFPPRWSKRLDYGLGQPTFTFTYTLPYYLTSVLMGTGIDAVWSVKILMAASFPLAAYFTFLWLRQHFGDWTSLTAGLIYAYLPYRFANVYVRGAIGEVTGSTLLPLTFWGLDSFLRHPNQKKFVLAAGLTAGLILAHQFYALIMPVVWLIYIMTTNFDRRVKLKAMAAIFFGYLLTSFYIIPAFVYRNLTYLDQLTEYFLEKQVFIDIPRLFYSPWGFAGVHETAAGPMSVGLGFLTLVGSFGFVAILKKPAVDTDNLRTAKVFAVIAAVSIFMMLPASLPIWKLLPVLMSLQFPWRWLFLVNLAIIFPIAYFLQTGYMKFSGPVHKTAVFFVILIILLLSSKDYWHVGRYYWASDLPDMKKSIGYPGTLTLLLEETPKWHQPRQESNPYSFVQNAEGKAVSLQNLVWKTNYHKIEVDTNEDIHISDKTHYWPGWRVWIDNKEVPVLNPYDTISQGLITFAVPSGKHIVETRLTEPPVNKIADVISLAGIGLAVLAVIRSRYAKVYAV